MDTLLGPTLSGPELAEAAGLSYRRVDYYTRVGLLSPCVRGGHGPGSRRQYDEHDIVRARLIGALLDLGATIPIVKRIIPRLPADPDAWPEFFFVTTDGELKLGLPLPAACWWISSRELRGHAVAA